MKARATCVRSATLDFSGTTSCCLESFSGDRSEVEEGHEPGEVHDVPAICEVGNADEREDEMQKHRDRTSGMQAQKILPRYMIKASSIILRPKCGGTTFGAIDSSHPFHSKNEIFACRVGALHARNRGIDSG